MDILELPKIIFRHSPPGKLDHAQRGTKCHILKSFQSHADVYIQLSQNDEDPIWEYCGTEPILNS
jgi:hypothetical protein